MLNHIEPRILILLLFMLSGVLTGIWFIIFSITTGRILRKKLKKAGEEPKVDLNVFSTMTILVLISYSSQFLERKHPGGYVSYHNWRIIKANQSKYNIVSAWILNAFFVLFAICFAALIISNQFT